MALPSTGALSFSDINTELGVSSTTLRALNDAAVRTLFGQASGAVDMNTGHGKSNRTSPTFTFAANATNQTVALASLSGYSAGKSCITITINSGVYVYSTSTATPAITFTGGTTGDVLSIVNLGKIMGKGCDAGTNCGAAGGNAICLSYPATINNTNASAYIGGGGGAGASGCGCSGVGGGGAGGGAGSRGRGIRGAGDLNGAGGAGGAIGLPGGDGIHCQYAGINPNQGYGGGAGGGGGGVGGSCGGCSAAPGSGGGGRIFPGSAGGAGRSAASGGAGNSVGGSTSAGGNVGGPGGGGWGASGGASSLAIYCCCCPSRFVRWYWQRTGGAGGKAVALNGKSVTWVSGCTARVYGGVS